MARKPNSSCEICGIRVYRRPFEIESGTHRKCGDCYQPRMADKVCPICNIEFRAKVSKQIYCGKSCSGKARRGPYTKKKAKNETQRRLHLLKDTFKFEECMIIGCKYTVCFDIHRHVPGSKGGQYEIGNMFAICPNHHAEITRGISKVEKIDNQTLKLEGQSDSWRRNLS